MWNKRNWPVRHKITVGYIGLKLVEQLINAGLKG